MSPECPVCHEEMVPVIGAGLGEGLRYLWWTCLVDRVATAVVPVPDTGIPAREHDWAL